MRAWLFTILRNLYINQRRYLERRPHETSIDDLPDIADRNSEAQGQRLAVRDVGDALAKLSESHREVILLVGLEGMGYKETAEILNIPVGTVMSRLSRGRETLKELLDQHGSATPTLRRVK